MSTPRPLLAGTRQMTGLAAALDEARAVAAALEERPAGARVAVCPPATLIDRLAEAVAGSAVRVGGQDCRAEAAGAVTGDVAAEMLAEAGARLVILGHSERRAGYGETDAVVAAKVEGALRAGLEPIICVGETLAERQAGRAREVVTAPVRGSAPAALAGRDFAIAYEPVWAICSGLTPSIEQIEEVHVAVRAVLVEMFGATGAASPILYGGSVKPTNAAEILSAREVGGALVGGASLKAADFLPIIVAA